MALESRDKKKLRIGLLTTANINAHLLATRQEPNISYEFVAVSSREPLRAIEYAREWNIGRACASYEELLGDPGVEAVYVAMPNALHHEWTLRALSSGKHVLCEKPYSWTPEAVGEAFEVAEAKGLVLTEGFAWRHNPQTRRLLELLPAIGDLRAIQAALCFTLTRIGDVRLDPKLGGGSLLDVGCYAVFAARLLSGREPDRVYGEAVLGPTGVDERFVGVLRFGEVVADFVCAMTFDHNALALLGSKGSIVAPDPWQGRTGQLIVNGVVEEFEPANAFRCELENFAMAVRGESSALIGRDEMRGQASALAALIQSVSSGCPVPV